MKGTTTFEMLACLAKLLLLSSLVNGAVFPNHFDPVFRHHKLGSGEGDQIEYRDLFQSDHLNFINPDIQAEFIKSLVVPQYVTNAIEAIGLRQLPSANLTAIFHGVDNKACIGHVLEWAIRAGDIENWGDLRGEDGKWVLHLIDSWGKFPEGILNGHINALGDFHECVQTSVRDLNILNKYIGKDDTPDNFEGRYCNIYTADYGTAMSGARYPINDTEKRDSGSGFGVRKAVSPGEFIQLLTNSSGVQMVPSVATCFPNSCTRGDIQQFLINVVDIYYKRGTTIPSPIPPEYEDLYPRKLLWPFVLSCYEDKKPDFDAGDISVIAILSIVLAWAFFTGVVDYWLNHENDKPPKRGKLYEYFMAFSLYSNTKAWMSTKRSAEDFGCLHGLRFFSTSWVILAHTYYAANFLPQWNMIDVKKVQEDWTILTVLNSSFTVDTFFVLSGFLGTYSIMKTLQKTNGKLNIITLYIKRYLRLTPTYAILVGIMATILPYMGNGPYWVVMNQWAEFCERNWWTNLLYVNNIVNTGNLCQGEAWYLGNDFQFHLLAPFIIYPMWRWEKFGLGMLAFYTTLSVISPAVVVYDLDISPTVIPTRDIGFGPQFTHLYIRPYTRIQTFLVGVWLGWILFKTKGKRVKLPMWIVSGFWLASSIICPVVIYSIHPWFDPVNPIPKGASLLYAGLSRFGFGLSVAWIIFACIKGYGGIANKILSWKVFMPLARLCYCVYLVSLHLQMILHLRMTHSPKYSTLNQVTFFSAHMVMSYLIGFGLWLLFESPFQNLQKLILP